MCPHHRGLEVPTNGLTRQGVCTWHDESNPYWAAACKHWPSKPAHIKPYPLCGYSFEAETRR